MTDIKISELPAAANPALTDVFAIVDGGTTSKITITQLKALLAMPAPTVTGFSPTYGVNTSVTITGTLFLGASAVSFNGTPAASFTVDSATQITATSPASFTDGPISVTAPSGVGTSADNFTNIQSYPTANLVNNLLASSLVLSDGAQVSTWVDSQSAGSYTASGTGPVYQSAALNSQPGVQFNGSSQFMTSADIYTMTGAFTTVLVVKRGTVGGQLVGPTSVGGGTAGVEIDDGGYPNKYNYGQSGSSDNAQSGTVATDTPYVVTLVSDGTIVQFYINGVSSGIGGLLGNPAAYTQLIGKYNGGGGSNYYDGWLFAKQDYSVALSAGDITISSDYWRSVYGF